MLGLNGGKQDLSYSILGSPSMQIDVEAPSFVNVN